MNNLIHNVAGRSCVAVGNGNDWIIWAAGGPNGWEFVARGPTEAAAWAAAKLLAHKEELHG